MLNASVAIFNTVHSAGAAYVSMHKNAKAREAYENVLRLRKDYFPAYTTLASLETDEGRVCA